jgi:serine/threonine protein kinase
MIDRDAAVSLDKSKKESVIKIEFKKSSTVSLKFRDDDTADIWFEALQPHFSMNENSFKKIFSLGKGSFSQVDLIQFNNKYFALKMIQKSLIEKHQLSEYVLTERDCMLKCQHAFVVDLQFCFQSSFAFFFGMEFAPGGDLHKITKREKLKSNDIRLILAEIAIALDHIHSKGYVYRDLKPENVVIGIDGYIKMDDFGMAKSIEDTGFSKDICGTAVYMSLEACPKLGYGYSCDWWSFGVLAYELICGSVPFDDPNSYKLISKITSANVRFPPNLDPVVKDFLQNLLVKNPKQRLNYEQIKAHQF